MSNPILRLACASLLCACFDDPVSAEETSTEEGTTAAGTTGASTDEGASDEGTSGGAEASSSAYGDTYGDTGGATGEGSVGTATGGSPTTEGPGSSGTDASGSSGSETGSSTGAACGDWEPCGECCDVCFQWPTSQGEQGACVPSCSVDADCPAAPGATASPQCRPEGWCVLWCGLEGECQPGWTCIDAWCAPAW